VKRSELTAGKATARRRSARRRKEILAMGAAVACFFSSISLCLGRLGECELWLEIFAWIGCVICRAGQSRKGARLGRQRASERERGWSTVGKVSSYYGSVTVERTAPAVLGMWCGSGWVLILPQTHVMLVTLKKKNDDNHEAHALIFRMHGVVIS
jgi:hypothetical protein